MSPTGEADGYWRPILPAGVRRGTTQEFMEVAEKAGVRVIRGAA